MRFRNKVAIVTGAAQGIGEAYAHALAAEGAAVVVADIDKKGQAVADAIRRAGGDAQFVEVDVSSNESTRAMAAAAIKAFGGIDFLVNNAAIYKTMKMAGLLGVDWDYYENVVQPPSLVTPTRPPADSTSWRTIARPIPAPPRSRSRDFSTR